MTDRARALIISTPKWWTVFGCLIAAASVLPLVIIVKLARLSPASPTLADALIPEQWLYRKTAFLSDFRQSGDLSISGKGVHLSQRTSALGRTLTIG